MFGAALNLHGYTSQTTEKMVDDVTNVSATETSLKTPLTFYLKWFQKQPGLCQKAQHFV